MYLVNQKQTNINVIYQEYLHNQLNINTYYYPYGMIMPGRATNSGSYRYGYNGMEMDNEVSGNGNSYDFGARMYNPRIGRWMSRDLLSWKKPHLTPYQGMKNNPIYFIDPDGNDEWQVVKIVNSKGEQLARISWRTSTTALMSGSYTKINDLFRVWHSSAGYDFKHVTTITINDDFEVIKRTNETMIIKENGIKDTRSDCLTCWGDGSPIPEGEIYNDGFEQPAGLYMTGSGGEGTKYYSKNTEYFGDIDLLLGVTSALGTKLSPAKEAFNEFMVSQATDALVRAVFSKDGFFPDDDYVDPNDVINSALMELKEDTPIVIHQNETNNDGDIWWSLTEGQRRDSVFYDNFIWSNDTLYNLDTIDISVPTSNEADQPKPIQHTLPKY